LVEANLRRKALYFGVSNGGSFTLHEFP
jgi:hypothetical protein